MLNVTTSADCQLFTLTTTDGYIEKLDAPLTSTCCTKLELGQNCCTDPYVTHYLRHQYNLVLSVTDCQAVTIDTVDYHEITFEVTGVDASCISSMTYYGSPNITTTVTSPSSLEFILRYTQAEVTPSYIFQHSVTLYTCDGNLAYSMSYGFNPNGFADPCAYVLNLGAISYPSLPDGVVINGATLEVSPAALGLTTFDDAVYYIALTQNSIPLTDKLLLDCNTQCKVIDLVSQDTCNSAYALYEALIAAQECSTITYEQMCQIWQYLGIRLGYFTTSPCEIPSDCGCS